jgi:LysR family transcriptional regulator, glycine cleavage system transcriptional activator
MDHLSFREELHAIEAVIAGQGIGIFSDVLVARELAAGTLVRPFDLCLPGYRFYLVRTPDHPREKTIHVVAVGRISLTSRRRAGASAGRPPNREHTQVARKC